jgi:hypothetical protein
VVELYADITAENLLSKHKEFQRSISEKLIESTTIQEIKDSTVNTSKFRAIHERFITDGSRTSIKSMSWIDIASPKEIGSLKKLYESPAGEKTVIWDNKTYFEHRPRRHSETEYAFASENIERNKMHVAIGYSGAPFEGICKGDIKPIVAFFDNTSEIVVEKDILPINGRDVECYSLSTENEDGKWKVWLCPEYDYNICRMEMQKKEGQLAYGVKLPIQTPKLDLKAVDPSIRPYLPTGDLTGLSFVLTDVKFEKIDGKWIAKEGRYITKRQYSDSRIQTDILEHKRTYIELSPNFNKAFVPEIKEGTRVRLEGSADDVIPYIWKGGQIVPGVDHEVEKIIDDQIELYFDNKYEVMEDIEPVIHETKTQQVEVTKKVTDVSDQKHIFIFLCSIIFVVLSICGAGFYLLRRKGNQEKCNG